MRYLLPAPTATDSKATTKPRNFNEVNLSLHDAVHLVDVDWGKYAPAIHRWEEVVSRPAPPALADNRLNPRFVEWMMGYPMRWVHPRIRPSDQLRLLGNSVVPRQASTAIRHLLSRSFNKKETQ